MFLKFQLFCTLIEPGRHAGKRPYRDAQIEELYPLKDSNTFVSRLGKSKFPDATSKNLWFIVFYKNEDPASQQVKPTVVKLAEVFKNTVKVGAVNCGINPAEERFCQSTFGGSGWDAPGYAMVVNGKVIPYNTSSADVIPSSKSLHEFIMENVPFGLVQNVNRMDQLQTRLIEPICSSTSNQSRNNKLGSIFLLSDKFETSTLYASLAYSYRNNFIFGESRAKNLALAKEFGVKKYPMIVALIPTCINEAASKTKASEGQYNVIKYEGEIKGDQISKWIDGLINKLDRSSKKQRKQ
jgi:hypothetical protein